MKRLSYEEKISAYLRKVKSFGRNLNRWDEIKFRDGTDMYTWFIKHKSDQSVPYVNKNGINEKVIERVKLFNNLIEEINKLERDIYIRKINDYAKKVRKLGKNIQPHFQFHFFDGDDMYNWFVRQIKYIERLNKRVTVLSKEEVERIKLFKNLLNEIENITKGLTYEERINEYIEKVNLFGQSGIIKADSRFSTGESMYGWYLRQNRKIKDLKNAEDEVIKENMDYIMLFASIDNAIYDEAKRHNILLFEERVNIYIDKIKKLGRNLTEEDGEFKSSVNMHTWYDRQIKKLKNEL